MKNLKFLVLGSNSFSGSNFINFILKKNYKVIGVSRSPEINNVFLSYKSSKNLNNFKFYKVDINKAPNKMLRILKSFRPNYIVNYIAQGMVSQSWDSPNDWYKTNILGQISFYKSLEKLKFIKKIIHVTTPEVYGSTSKKIKENFNFKPSTPYAISRAATDTHLKKSYDNFKFPIIFTRTANIYGPGQQLYRIVPKTIISGIQRKKIFLHGGGNSKRSFIYVKDASEATLKICVKGKLGETYHISTNKIISIKSLVNLLCKLNHFKYKNLVSSSKDRVGKDKFYILDSTKIRRELGWKPKTTLEHGLERTSEWIKKNIKILKKQKTYYIHKV